MLKAVANLLYGVGTTCLVLGLAGHLQADISNKYCQMMEGVHCQYHPCRCEDGTTVYGCTASTEDEASSSWCQTGTKNCSSKVESCGDKVVYDPNEGENCNNCGGGVSAPQPCNQSHNCLEIAP